MKNWKGILFAVTLGLLAMLLEKFTPSYLNSILIALIVGILVGNIVKIPGDWDSGIGYTSSKMLEISILFLAVGINYSEIANLGAWSFLGLIITIFIVLTAGYFLSKYFQCPGNTGLLVCFGTAICGSSAIAALAPSLKKNEKEDVAIAMAVVNLYGTLGMLLLPWVLMKIGLNDATIGYLVGGSLHSVGNVAGAGFTIGKIAGDAAITVKLARVALLTPGLIYITYLINRNSDLHWKTYLKLPWYLVGFMVVTVLVSLVDLAEPITKEIEYLGKVILTIAMVAIGLKVSFKKLLNAGKRGLKFGLVIFLIQIILLSAVMGLMN